MATATRRPTLVMVRILDLSSLEKAAFQRLPKSKYPKATRCRADEVGIVETARGIYALDSDGVGQSAPISASNKCRIDLWAEWSNGGHSLATMTADLDADDLLRLPFKKTVNLADFIKSFGARLETNYEAWRKALAS